MKEENKKCWSCAKFERYYTKGFCALQKEKVGFCSLQSKIVDKDDSCKMWNFRQRVRNIRKKMAINSIIEIRSKLDVIEQILTEERDAEIAKNEK